jgi:spore germination protein (amino acid permease)
MQKEQHISKMQAACISAISFYGVVLYYFKIPGRAGWLIYIGAFVILIPLAFWILYLADLYPGKTLLEIVEITVGKLISRVINLIFIFITIIMALCLLNFYASLLQTYFLINTPIWVVILVITILSTFISKSGIEVLGRLNIVLLVLAEIIFFAADFSGIGGGQFRLENILPVFFESPLKYMKSLYEMTGIQIDGLLILFTMTTAFPMPKKYFKAVTIGFLIAAISFGTATIIIIAGLGADQASTVAYSAINLVQLVQIGAFIHGMEIFVTIPFQFVVFSKCTLYLYSCWTAAKQIFSNWKPQLHLWVLFMVVTAAAIWINSYNTAYYITTILSRYVMLPFILLVLSIATIGCLVKRRKRGLAVK